MEKVSGNSFLYLSATIANLLALMSGIAYGWSSPVLPKLSTLDSENPLAHPVTATEESWIVSLLSLGAVFGPILSGYAADKIGRKRTLLILAFPILVSFIMLAFAKTVTIFYIARFLLGLSVGSIFMINPMYLVEIAEDHNRGTLGCLMGVFITAGLLLAYAVGPYLSVQNFCLISTIPLIIFIPLFSIWNPESPVYLARANRRKELKISLLKTRNKPLGEIEKEMLRYCAEVQQHHQTEGGLLKLLNTRSLRKGLRIAVSLILLQQFSGINAVLSYMQTIFATAHSPLSPEFSAVIIGFIQVCATVLTSTLADRLGRRILLLLSIIGSCFSLTTLGVYFFLLDRHYEVGTISWLPVASLVAFIVFFNLGMASVPWTVMAELFPPNVKSVALTLTTVTCFIAVFIVTLCFPSLTLFLGMAQSFWVFAAVCAGGAVFIYLGVPETKGRSLQEIQSLLGI